MFKVLYLCSGTAFFRHLPSDISVTYNDLEVCRDLMCDMRDIDLTAFDCVVASPPCNYWSRANYRRDSSPYALATKPLLPWCISQAKSLSIPFCIENVKNHLLFRKSFDSFGLYTNLSKRHTYWSNRLYLFESMTDFESDGVSNLQSIYRQGDEEVHDTFERFILNAYKLR